IRSLPEPFCLYSDGRDFELARSVESPELPDDHSTMHASWLRKPFISSEESTEGMRFGSLGVGTRRAGLSFNFPSRTQYLKKERSAASLRAMELFSSPWSCKCETNSRIMP